MNKWISLDIAGAHNPSRYPQATNEQLHNFYVSNQDGKQCLFPYVGYEVVNATFGDSDPRAIFYSNIFDALLLAFGTFIYIARDIKATPQILNPDLPFDTSVGTVYVAEAVDTKQIMFTAGGKAYLLDDKDADTFQTAPIPDGVVPSNVIYAGKSFIICDTLTSRWFVSEVNNGKVWEFDSLPIEGRIDSKCVGVASVQQLVLVFGTEETTVFENVGTIPFPYQQNRSYHINYGCLNVETIAQGFGLVCWVAGNSQSSPLIMVCDGGQPKPISTENIDSLIDDLENPSICEGFIFQQDGHIFYQVNWISDNVSLMYDFTTRQFSKISEDKSLSKVQYLAADKNKTYCLLRGQAGIYDISNKIPTYDGKRIDRIRITKNQYFETPIFVNEIRIRMQLGVDGLPAKERISDDLAKKLGGLTFKKKYESINDLEDAKKGDYWDIDNNLSILGVRVYPNEAIVCANDITGIPTNLNDFIIATKQPLGRVRVSVSHDYGVSFPFFSDLELAPLGEREYYLIRDNFGSSRLWTFKLEFISELPFAVLGAEARVSEGRS